MSQISTVLDRLRRTLSQSEISRRTGITQYKLSRWEAGNVATGADDALKLVALDKEISDSALATPTLKQRSPHK